MTDSPLSRNGEIYKKIKTLSTLCVFHMFSQRKLPLIRTVWRLITPEITLLSMTCSHSLSLSLENGRLSDRYRIVTDTGCIVSNPILLYRPILRASLQVHQLLTDHITHDDQRAFKRPVTARRARMRACCFMVHDTGEGWREGRRKETVTWYRHPLDTKTAQYWSWPPSRRTPSTSRKW